jgi:tetratricopeptide (TPR) repeat protein
LDANTSNSEDETMAKPKWTPFPYPDKAFTYTGDALKKHWGRLHRGDCEPFPKDPGVQEAWRQYHRGAFEQAVALGLAAGGAGLTVANKAQSIYANSLEKKPAARMALLEEAMKRAEAQAAAEPRNPNAHYQYAYAAGRYSQGISIAKALAQGFGGRIRAALEATLKLAPKHAEAHTAMGAYHAEIINKVGALVGGLTYGAKKEAGEEHFRKALKLAPDSPIAHVEFANGLVMLHGKKALEEASALYAKAASLVPCDAMEKLDVEAARAELE